MYRQYEDPYKLEKMLEERKAELKREAARCEDLDDLIPLYEEIEELKDRINFAWQDDEYDSWNDDLQASFSEGWSDYMGY